MNRINAPLNRVICLLLTVLMCSPALAGRASLRAQRTGGVCGDGVVDSHEVCDEGKELNGSGPGHCNWDCQGFTPANTTVPTSMTPQGTTGPATTGPGTTDPGTSAPTTPASTTTLAPTTTPAPGGLSDGAIIGIVIGSVAGAALLGVGIFFIAKACMRGGAAGAAAAPPAAPAVAGQTGQVVVDL